MKIEATRQEFRNFCANIISLADSDVGEQYNEETAEIPEEVEERLTELEEYAFKYGGWKFTIQQQM